VPPFNDDKGSYCTRSTFNVTLISNPPPTLGQSSSTSVEHHTTLTQTSRIDVHGVSVDVACHIDRVRELWPGHGKSWRTSWLMKMRGGVPIDFYFQSFAAIELVANESVPARYCVSSKNTCNEWQCQSSRCAPWVKFWWVDWAKVTQRPCSAFICEKRSLCARPTLTRPFPFNHNPNDRAPRYLRDAEVRLLAVKY